jgi:oxygen-dependent protoporphyrinogen oxidase
MSSDRPHDSQQPRPTRIAVVGGGISGLAAANRLIELSQEQGRPIELMLFHDGMVFGGAILTQAIQGYLAETGADSFITSKPWAVDLCRRLGLEDQLIETDSTFRRSLVLRKGRPVAVPEGFTLLSPAKVWPVVSSPLFSPWGKLRMGMDYFLPRKKENGDESLAAFVRRRFGQEALERLVQPLVGGIYTSDPEKLSLQATMPRFLEMEQEHGSLIRASRRSAAMQSEEERGDSGARYSLFLSLAGGLSQLVDALVARVLKHHKIFRQTTISEIVPHTADADAIPEQTGRWKLNTRNVSPK